MYFYQAYQDVGDGKIVSLGPLRNSAEEALQDLRDNNYEVHHLKPCKFGTYFSPQQGVGVSVTRI